MTVASMVGPHGNSVILLRPLAAVLGRLGVDPEGFLREVGVEPDAPADTYVPNAQVDAALERIAEARGDPSFGMTLARDVADRPPLGLFGHLVWISATVRDALTQAARFYGLVTRRATLSLHEDAAGASFTQRMREGAPRGRILAEYFFASFVLRARAATGGAFRVRAMRFAHPGRASSLYDDVFGAPVTFDGASDGADVLSLDLDVLDLPLPSADPFTAAALEAQVAQLRVAPAEVALAERVRGAVAAQLGVGRPSLQAIARRLGLGGRALRRQLAEEAVSLRAVVASAQREHAVSRLARGASIKEVAFELGFSEPSAFSRAYKRWTGRPPSTGKAKEPPMPARSR